ncbi:MAG: nuclear transport factor 2 family protein [Bdellovibrionaceae bacterium]|nr:nuclear transport factor 2 family protein [Pseudobdellovibrionaceae bacterium]
MDARLERFLNHFNELNRDSINVVGLMYAEDVSFQDPLHEIQGLPHLKKYFTRLYKHTESCRFEWDSRLMLGNEAMIAWRMQLKHRFLNSGKAFSVPGATLLRFQPQGDLVIYQRDYFDVGAMLYERMPVLGTLIRTVKSQV